METKIRVLIADPNEDLRLLLKDALESEEDMEVAATAADGAEALRLIAEERPDVVLLELVLPKLDGFGVLRKLSETPNAPASPGRRHGPTPTIRNPCLSGAHAEDRKTACPTESGRRGP